MLPSEKLHPAAVRDRDRHPQPIFYRKYESQIKVTITCIYLICCCCGYCVFIHHFCIVCVLVKGCSELFFKNRNHVYFLFIYCVNVCLFCMYVYAPYARGVRERQKWSLDALGLEIHRWL